MIDLAIGMLYLSQVAVQCGINTLSPYIVRYLQNYHIDLLCQVIWQM